jgi:GH24 family phage-related lysozyme (muramidase)
MKISKNCINLVKSFEGYHKKLPNGDCTTYVCPAGVLTLGYGSTTGFKEGDVWTPQQAVEALKRELAKFEDAVNGLVTVDITQNQFDALVSFAYNVGSGALTKSSLLKKLNKGNYVGASAEFHKWNKGGGKVLPGLVRRRAQEAELFLTPDASSEPVMPQAVDMPTPVRDALRKSRTIFSSLSAAGAFLAYVYREAIEIALAAAAEFETLAPLGKLLAALGVSVAGIALVTAFASLAGPIFARLDDAHKGKTVK